MFRNKNKLLKLNPENGKKIIIRARISFYETRGEFQCIAEHLEESGEGLLQQQFEDLKHKLNTAGFFNSEHKQPIPTPARCLGIITSPSGAVIHDILTTLKRRYPAQQIIIYPVLVQGSNAANQISKAIKIANQRNECDCLIIARGGGSLEDLWPFNEELVANSIYNSQIPIVSAIGHEVDVTIADFVADHRAPTPTAAAEFVSPDQSQIEINLQRTLLSLKRLIIQKIVSKNEKLKLYNSRLTHPGHYLQSIAQRLDELTLRMNNNCEQSLNSRNDKLNHLIIRFNNIEPTKKLILLKQRQITLSQQLINAWKNNYQQKKYQSTLLARALNTVSPLATLNRGYAIVKHINSNTIIRSYTQIDKNAQINITLSEGQLICHVEQSKKS